jgi:hypothetical protein
MSQLKTLLRQIDRVDLLVTSVQTMTGEDVDVRDGYKLLQRLTAAAAYKDRDALSFPTAELHTAKVSCPSIII